DFVLSAIENVGLLDKKDKMINELSGGQLQRVFLARAFAQDPKVLLLDEPTNHLDLKSQIELLDYINRWKEEKARSVIGVIHDLNLVQNFGDKVVIMNRGELVLEGSPRDAFNDRRLSEVYELNVKEFMISVLEKWTK
ncbi:MAG: ABC transporter ATP-binding protein, partial [Clostridium sp.]